MKLSIGKLNKLTKATRYIFLCLVLSSCGGGGGGSETPIQPSVQTGSSDWGAMEWDQDNWG